MRCCILALLCCTVYGGLRSDLDGDGYVDFKDFAIFALEWNMSDLDSYLVAHYKMDDDAESTDVIDEKGNDGTAQQNTEDLTVAGKVGTALSFNGTTDYITIPHNADLNFGTGNFSICLWVKNTNVNKYILYKQNAYNKLGFYITIPEVSSGRIALTIDTIDGSGGIGTWISETNVSDGQWRMIVFSANRTAQEMAIYISSPNNPNAPPYLDGDVMQSMAGYDLSFDNNEPIIIGKGNLTDRVYDGYLDDIRIYNKALTYTDVYELYTGYELSSSGSNQLAADGTRLFSQR